MLKYWTGDEIEQRQFACHRWYYELLGVHIDAVPVPRTGIRELLDSVENFKKRDHEDFNASATGAMIRSGDQVMQEHVLPFLVGYEDFKAGIFTHWKFENYLCHELALGGNQKEIVVFQPRYDDSMCTFVLETKNSRKAISVDKNGNITLD